MATTVTLKIKDENGNVTKQNHEIEDIDLSQFQQMMETINEIIGQLRKDDSLKSFVGELFGGEYDPEKDAEDMVKEMDTQFILKAVNSFETLLIRLPEQAYKLLSILSGIELSVLKKQKLIDVLDIYDAILEENDIERLINRIKKSLALTGAKLKFKALVQKATQKVTQTTQQ